MSALRVSCRAKARGAEGPAQAEACPTMQGCPNTRTGPTTSDFTTGGGHD